MNGTNDAHREQPPIRRVQAREVFRNRYITVYDDDVIMPGEQPGRYLRIEQSGGRPGVAILATCGDLFALVKEYRYPIGDWEWGIPRGFAHGDDPLESALGELGEELGALPNDITLMGAITPNSGLLADRVLLFHARYDEPVDKPSDMKEIVEVRWAGLNSILEDIATGKLIDGFTLSALTMAAARGLLALPNLAAGR
jgi:8-oxo-dGTP pyrophosphatase MutT (NUDIX family)